MFKKKVVYLLFLVVGLIIYYSWLPDPNMRSETYLPRWLLDWSNNYYNLRTAVPFIAFGYLLNAFSQSKTTKRRHLINNFIFIKNLGIAAIVVSVVECGQFLIKDRTPDIMDVYFGTIGSLIGSLLYILFNKKNNK